MENNKSVPEGVLADLSLKEHLNSIAVFLESYDLEESEKILWDLLINTFTCDNVDLWDGFRRNNTLLFYKQVLDLIKGVFGIAIPMFNHFQYELPIQL